MADFRDLDGISCRYGIGRARVPMTAARELEPAPSGVTAGNQRRGSAAVLSREWQRGVLGGENEWESTS
jgi:hypothetical protein